ncbi:peptide/nickel transport system permease protein [Hydrogenivirga caldilitoris]|uniref:Peptide/nickel transport system permease protein n=1 Tax=Hydrogenivirga caldilitoris TaxID=246264 RepID=A0A497XSJ5_9AQUI|nr:ABC transporter permease [Hydrogenivirga caldilitoris]RLJ69893.1 peptide/nickel transport system permease protein [Hydrogenivirga caldilitoris]
MFKFILLRILQAIPTILGVTFISFLIIKLAPGDFLDQLKLNPQISPETIERLKKIYGLDQPALIQYIKWLKSALLFDLGYSFQYHAPVTQLIAERIPNTLLLSVSSALLSWTLAIPLGMLAAFKEGTKLDKLIQAYAYSFMSVPSFFLAFLFLLVASRTGWFPIGGVQSPNFEELSLMGKVLDILHHLFIPAMTLALVSLAGLTRLVRSSVIEVLKSPFITMLKAKGASRATVVKHVFKNAMNPFTTLLGYEVASLISGAALIEIITGWPGMGMLMLDAVLSQDLFLVMGGLYIGTIMLIVGNLFADLMLAWIDPRVREREFAK